MNKILKNFGFGCMRLPMKNNEVNTLEFSKMVDYFIDNGFNYFDTAHGYLGGKSETALKESLTSRYKRDKYILTNKLTNFYFKKESDIRPFFESQLESCGVSYFDYYLMHAQSVENFAYFKKHRAYEIALELKEEGKIKHFGISFHDKAATLEEILKEYPQIEIVQIQFNYIDYDNPAVESRKCLEICQKYNKPVIVMEPVKGGNLANLPEDAKAILDKLYNGSPASYAIRYAASFDGIKMVLSGMSDMKQMQDNISFMKDFKALNNDEMNAINKVKEIFQSKNMIACTACRYCIDGCPMNIEIPNLFACMNSKKVFNDWNTDYYYNEVYTKNNGKASDCIKCGKCEKACPQHLPIRDLLVDVANEFEHR